jgi:superfamily II DNA or RNA helicase
MADILVEFYDNVHCHVVGSQSVIGTVADQMTFEIPNAKFHPLVKAGVWDGSIKLLNRMNGLMYVGLIKHLQQVAADFDFTIEIVNEFDEDPFSVEEARKFIGELKAPHVPHDFQESAFINSIQTRRGLILSPTSSGKSFLMYLIIQYLQGKKILLVCHLAGLVRQLTSDFVSYGFKEQIHQVEGGTEKDSDARLTIGLWQSLYKMPKKYFQQYDVIIADEVHRFSSKSLIQLMEKTTSSQYKIGVTGSLTGSKTNELALTGLFGPIYKTITTREMIDRGLASDIDIKVFLFSYPKAELDLLPPKLTYQDEVNFIIGHPLRNRFINNLANSLPGNVLILFRRVEDHADFLIADLEKRSKKKVFFIHGGVKADKREAMRPQIEAEDGVIIVASDGTFSEAISINNIQHILKVNPLKSLVNTVQSIGRGLRKDGKQDHVTWYDFADDLTKSARKKGFLLTHLLERLKIYTKEQHPFKIYKIKLEEKQ